MIRLEHSKLPYQDRWWKVIFVKEFDACFLFVFCLFLSFVIKCDITAILVARFLKDFVVTVFCCGSGW